MESRRVQNVGSKCRNVRVFISSTFRDMHEDREVILKQVRGCCVSHVHFWSHVQVVPKLSAFCKDRSVFLSVVDLRWGITSDQTNEGETLNICLKEVDR